MRFFRLLDRDWLIVGCVGFSLSFAGCDSLQSNLPRDNPHSDDSSASHPTFSPVAQDAAPARAGTQATPAPSDTRKDLPLRWELGPGRRAKYLLENVQKAENAVDQMKQRSESTILMAMTLTGQETGEHNLESARLTYDELAHTESSQGESKSYHSGTLGANESDSIQNTALRSLVGEGCTIVLAPNGRVHDVTDTEDMYRSAKSRIKDKDAAGWLDLMLRYFDRDMLIPNLTAVFDCVPNADVKAGDTWKSIVERTSHAGQLLFERTWRLDSMDMTGDGLVAHISCSVVVSLPKNDGLLSNVYLTTIGRGEGAGEVVFDAQLGLVRSARLVTTFEFLNHPKVGVDPYQYKPYTQSLEDTLTLTLLATGDKAQPAARIESPDMAK